MASISQTAGVRPVKSVSRRGGLVDKYFYLAMGLLTAGIVLLGFGGTVGPKLIHPAVAPPRILWVHGAVFSTWIVFFILQSALVRTRNVRQHRFLGWFGAGLGLAMVPLGIATAIAMVRFETYRLHQAGRYAFIIIPFFDIAVFAVCLVLAIWWRRKPELHRRLIFLATCGLLTAAFARIDDGILRQHALMYCGVDAVMLLGVLRDYAVTRQVHKVYLVALPVYITAQMFVIYMWRVGPEWWVRFARMVAG